MPDEARQYIANMADSPLPSPRIDVFATRLKPLPAHAASRENGRDDHEESEFLDMDEEDEDSEEEDDQGNNLAAVDHSEIQNQHNQVPQIIIPVQATPKFDSSEMHAQQNFSPEGPPSDHEFEIPIARHKEKLRVVAEEFPLPPPSNIYVHQHQAAIPHEAQHQYPSQHAPQHGQAHTVSTPGPSTSKHARAMPDQSFGSSAWPNPQDSELSMPENSYPQSSHRQIPQQQVRDQQKQQQQAVPASFRALPLLPTDLPHTTINVSHSFVRPNDRGKEVLSFVVFVSPGQSKEGWKVEKLYSDVLSLDQRVRSSVGKGVGKKIANLPEGKLWKDHAPAKVDQRKAVLENYLQTLINLPVKNNNEVIAFFTSDIVRETNQPVMQIGHKEGYLTKRGKNFGGWKTRFFVLQGPVLEYYDCRGGAHLGSITITGAQIARQHRTERLPATDDEKEYRHAFLIVEAKKGPGGNHPRHVLCAESDEDRDSWVELLVRYYTGTYSEELVFNSSSGLSVVNSIAASIAAQSGPRSSTSSNDSPILTSRKPPVRGMSRDDAPTSQVPLDASTKLFQPPPLTLEDYVRSSSPSKSVDPSPIDRPGGVLSDYQNPNTRRTMERGLGLPSSLPDSSPLSAAQGFQSEPALVGQRANSELGHYPDMQDPPRSGRNQRQPEHRSDGRKSFHPTLNTLASVPFTPAAPERASSPEKFDVNGKVKISGPLNGAPIPSGFKFGGKDAPSAEATAAANDRREKAKSRSFWGFGKANGDKSHPHVTYISRAVFGVPLEEALEVAQICNLPAIVFRSIQYLEAKKADQEEGIYRLSGSSAVIKSLKDRFNNEGDLDLLASDEYWDPHAIAGLLKSFLRELPASILTRDLHLRFLSVIDFVDAQERIKELSQLISALPIANYSLLRALTAHLILIVQNSGVNKMTMRNVGIVFSPTLGIPAGVFSLMLGEFNRVFNVDSEYDDYESPRGEQSGEALSHQVPEPFRRNSRQYSDAAADQLLGLSGRTLTTPAEETQSDGDDFSLHDESGTETTEGEVTIESSSPSSPIQSVTNLGPDPAIRVTPPETPTASKTSKASHVAASRGLNVAVTTSERGNRHSRMMGLPSSPRPQNSPSRPPDLQTS